MKKMTAFVLAVLMLLSLAACGSSGSAGSSKILGVMLGTNVMSLDTDLATDGDSFEVIADCIDGLMQMDADGAAVFAIAKEFSVSDDGCTYTFSLRDAKWSNGDPVTAGDFVFAWQRICKNAGEYAYMMDEIANIKGAADIIANGADPATLGVSAPDDKTLVVELEVPVSFFPSLMVFPTFYPINEKFFNSLEDGTYGTSPETFLSNGAFLLDSYTPGTASLSLKKNPDYWDADRIKLDGLQKRHAERRHGQRQPGLRREERRFAQQEPQGHGRRLHVVSELQPDGKERAGRHARQRQPPSRHLQRHRP